MTLPTEDQPAGSCTRRRRGGRRHAKRDAQKHTIQQDNQGA